MRHRLQSAIPHSHRFLLQRARVRAGASAMVLGGKGGGAGHGHRRMAAAAVQRWDWGRGSACHLDRTRLHVSFFPLAPLLVVSKNRSRHAAPKVFDQMPLGVS